MPAWQGALPALYAATSSEVKGNDYYGPDGTNELRGYPAAAVMSDAARDQAAAGKLWDYAEQTTGIFFPRKQVTSEP